MTKATDNASKSVANANTVPILESIPRAFTIANTRPINAIAPTKANITAAIAPTCFLSIDLALLAINKAVDKAIISKANDPAISMQDSISNLESRIKIPLRTNTAPSINSRVLILMSLQFLLVSKISANAPNIILIAPTAAYNLSVSSNV